MAKTKGKKPARQNPVAKHGVRFNKSAVHKDKKKAQKRGASRYPKAPPAPDEE